ncbi:Asp23/Gls24 family envelope stress response protein [Natranaerofaba carboxydovora]|uniref:Asp23/Gls24 family envelope stress response protein n=1 Tax=Natranaerofaba carboxydovora TaxID=2742683 RepID=UPI001F132B25|nr:Asp23/Gls24 family envelope stress response protein [Natranaerofaba carboxydovora]UMZ75008.1 Alkaline shock protein 23 [Natranaerofaba carboxydovora]
MANNNEKEIALEVSNQQGDTVKIVDDVIAIIAGIAATKIEGVSSMSGGFVGNIAERIGRKDLAKGVKVETTENQASVDVYLIVKYGVKIHEVAENVQKQVRDAVSSMTGMEVPSVTVNVQGVELEEYLKEIKELEEPAEEE